MFNSLLNAGSGNINSLILDVFIIFAVVLAGSLIIYFLFEMVNAIVSKSGKPKDEDRLIFDEKEKNAEVKGIVESFNIDEQKSQEPVALVENVEEAPLAPETVEVEETVIDVDDSKAEAEKAELDAEKEREERENAERRAYLEARRQEILRRMQENSDKEETEEQPSEENVETEQEETTEEVEEPAEVEQPTPEADHLEGERRALEEEKQRYATMVRELEEAKKALAEIGRASCRERVS